MFHEATSRAVCVLLLNMFKCLECCVSSGHKIASVN